MILDSSALIAILFEEPEANSILEKIHGSTFLGIGTPTVVETGIVLTRNLGTDSEGLLDTVLKALAVRILPFDEDHWHVAIEAFHRFGKGRHPAALNFGDCMSYATAKLAGELLLCTGDDFPKTDLELA